VIWRFSTEQLIDRFPNERPTRYLILNRCFLEKTIKIYSGRSPRRLLTSIRSIKVDVCVDGQLLKTPELRHLRRPLAGARECLFHNEDHSDGTFCQTRIYYKRLMARVPVERTSRSTLHPFPVSILSMHYVNSAGRLRRPPMRYKAGREPLGTPHSLRRQRRRLRPLLGQ